MPARFVPNALSDKDQVGYTFRQALTNYPLGDTTVDLPGPLPEVTTPGEAEAPMSGYSGIQSNGKVGADINAGGTSIDQLLAQHLGTNTKLPSIELGIESPAKGVDTNVNITRLYSNHIAWSSASTRARRSAWTSRARPVALKGEQILKIFTRRGFRGSDVCVGGIVCTLSHQSGDD